MRFVFHKASCVAIGTFNIYIIQPKLLAEMGLIKGELSNFAGDLTQPGIRFHVDGATWHVRPERLSVETDDPAVDCGELISGMLAKLAWTPVMAIGSNTVFRCSNELEDELPQIFRPPHHSLTKFTQRMCQFSIAIEDVDLGFQLAVTQDHIEVVLNAHTDLAKLRGSKTQLELNELARAACNDSMSLRNTAVNFAKELTEGEFIYA